MSKLFVFGDSFVNRTMVQFSDGSIQDVFGEQTWVVQLARKLNCDEINNYGMIGSGIDFSLWRLLSLFQEDSEETIDPENDFIIFALSNAKFIIVSSVVFPLSKRCILSSLRCSSLNTDKYVNTSKFLSFSGNSK